MPRFEEIPRVHIIEREEMLMNKTKKNTKKDTCGRIKFKYDAFYDCYFS